MSTWLKLMYFSIAVLWGTVCVMITQQDPPPGLQSFADLKRTKSYSFICTVDLVGVDVDWAGIDVEQAVIDVDCVVLVLMLTGLLLIQAEIV